MSKQLEFLYDQVCMTVPALCCCFVSLSCCLC
jgi:hypothetical protein